MLQAPPSPLNDIATHYINETIGLDENPKRCLFHRSAQQEYVPSPKSAQEVYKRRAGQTAPSQVGSKDCTWVSMPCLIGRPLGKKERQPNSSRTTTHTSMKPTIGTGCRGSRVRDLKEPRSAYNLEWEAFTLGGGVSARICKGLRRAVLSF